VARQIGRAMDANEMRERVERLEQDVIVDIQDTIGTPWPAASSLRVYGRRRVRLLGAPPCCVRPYSQHTHWARAVSLCQSFERPCARLTVSRLADTVQKQVNQASEFLSKMRKESKLQEEDDSDENSDSISASTSSLSSSDEDDES
jgi:hypothetical protein